MVQGVSCEEGSYSVFRGIPYAKPPVGERRFAPAEKAAPWESVRSCSTFGPAPVQPTFGKEGINMSEDCLYLNIYTPAKDPEEKLPVMFWIYGGGFTFGYSHEDMYHGGAISKSGCVFVSINYRTNIFGFFNTPELAEKNGGARCCGILDQILALEWVRDNISGFGGDPDNVLIFGQSAGGLSTRMHLAGPLSQGLFAKAIVHSGGGLCEADLVRSTDEFTDMCVRTLEYVGWSFEDVMTRPAQEVFDVMMKGVRDMMADGDLYYFQPFVDGFALTEVPGKAIHSGNYAKVPIMCGTVAGDSWMFSRKVRSLLEGDNEYFKGFALCPSIAWGRHNIKAGYPPIYSYYFDRPQPEDLFLSYTSHGEPPFGADCKHGSELPYIFGTLDTMGIAYAGYDYELAEVMRSYWINFAKTGDPNGEGLAVWPLFEAGSELSMHFGKDDVGAADLVCSEDLERVMRFSEDHPGMLCSLEGF